MAERAPSEGEIASACVALIALIDVKMTLRVCELHHPEDNGNGKRAEIEVRERNFLRYSPKAIAEARARVAALANQ